MFKDKKIQQSIPDNFFVFAMIKQNKVVPQPILTPIIIKEIVKFINENTYSSVVLICRSEKEPQRTDSYPSSTLIDQLVNQIKKDTYLF